MGYRYDVWCVYRDGGCPNRCLFGCHYQSVTFDTPEQAYHAGEEGVGNRPTWDFTVVDERGVRVPMGIVAPVSISKKRKHKKKEHAKI